MSASFTALASLMTLSLVLGAQEPKQPVPAKKTTAKVKVDPKQGYALGLEAGARLKKLGTPVDLAAYTKAVEDVMKGRKTRMTNEEATKLVQQLEAEGTKLALERNRAEGAKFLAENKAKPGVQTTASGLQYQILREGDGDKPGADDTVKVHYRGTFLDGSEFDSSYKRNEPIKFPLKGVIRGWTEGLQFMKVGSKAKFFIPYDLAYGERGRGGIPPASLLLFEVELLAIDKAAPKPAVK